MRKSDPWSHAVHAQTAAAAEVLPSSGNEPSKASNSSERIVSEAQSILSQNIFRILNDRTIPSNVRKILRSAIISFRRNAHWTLVERFETVVGERHYIRIDRVTLIILVSGDVRTLENILFAGCLNDGPSIDPTPGAALPLTANRQFLTANIQRQGNRGYLVACCRALILILGAISFYLCANVKGAIAGMGAPSGLGLLYRPGPGTTKQIDKFNAKTLIKRLCLSVFSLKPSPINRYFSEIWQPRIRKRATTTLFDQSYHLSARRYRGIIPILISGSYYRHLLLAAGDAAKDINEPPPVRKISLTL
jgi:hypothetical protein